MENSVIIIFYEAEINSESPDSIYSIKIIKLGKLSIIAKYNSAKYAYTMNKK